ncbi:MAG TPA: IS630 family transposase [Ktedonobacterales bacterium]|nr:IS630 family transposase [Ktedonobacterales bacterium]
MAALADVLDLYEEEYDPLYPTVCLDEQPVVLHEQTRPVLPLAPGRPERRDDEYVRRGTANLFVVVEPLSGWRQVTPTMQRTRVDYAQQLRCLAAAIDPDAEYIRLVQDNLNPHTLASLYAVFPPSEARRIASRFEVHYTPKHGSWLNMAEIAISVFERGCLSRPVADFETLDRRVKTLEAERNAARCSIHWQFTSQKARTKLVDLYPVKQT